MAIAGPAKDTVLPAVPVGALQATPAVVQTGTYPTLCWSIVYPSKVSDVATITPPGTLTLDARNLLFQPRGEYPSSPCICKGKRGLVYKGFVVSAKDGYTLPTETDEKADMEDMIDEYVHGFRRWLALNGFDMQELGGQVIDPTGMFKILVSIIAAATDIPQRRLIGSERGELASSQDETNWNSTIAGRRLSFAEPVILRPFIDRMIFAGVLPEPQGEYMIEWPDAFEIDQIERAKLAKNVAQALSYVAPDGQIHMIVNPAEFVRKFFPDLVEGLTVVNVDELIAEVEEIAQRKLEMEAEFSQPVADPVDEPDQ